MSTTLRVLAIPGSLRRASVNRALLVAAGEEAPTGIEVAVWDDLEAIPHFNEDKEGERTPPAVLEFRRQIDEADALLISTPEYNSSIPGVLKNALDWASRPYGVSELVGKPVAVVGASASPFGATWAQAELRKVLTASGGRVLEEGLSFAKAPERLDADGRVADPALRSELATLLDRLADAVRSVRAEATEAA
jgi:chromate reductase